MSDVTTMTMLKSQQMLMQTCVGAYSNIIGAVREREGRCLAYILKGPSPRVLSVSTAFDKLIVETR